MICQTVWCLLSSASLLSAEVSLAAAPWPCCPLGGKLFGQGPQESTQEWICYVDESLGVPRLHHFQLAFLYFGEGQKCKKMLSGTGRLPSSQRCWVRLGTAWSHREPREFAVPDGPQTWLLVYKEKLGLWSLRGKQFSGSQNSHLSCREP